MQKFEKPLHIRSCSKYAIMLNSGLLGILSMFLNTRICMGAFENYNLTTLNNHSVLTSPFFSPYVNPAKPLEQSWEVAHLYACCLFSTENGHPCLTEGWEYHQALNSYRREKGILLPCPDKWAGQGRDFQCSQKLKESWCLGWLNGEGERGPGLLLPGKWKIPDEPLGWTPPYSLPPLPVYPNL